eukprot:jgi/Tetstr1/442479/TSEL_030579.t1
MLAARSDPIHVAVLATALAFDAASLAILNRYKTGSGSPCSWSWPTKRAAYWAYIVGSMAFGCWLDYAYDVTEYMIAMRNYALVYPCGLLDFYFSDTKTVSMRTLAGAALWCFSVIVRLFLTQRYIGQDMTHIVDDLSPLTIGKEVLRFTLAVPFIGILTDLMFSPMHRLSHRVQYSSNHKMHHEYTNKLTSLVLYHGTLLDDFLMPATTTIGGFLYIQLATLLGLQSAAFSNFVEWLLLYNTLFSHAHDVRCANLIVPLPPSMNFGAYHRVHHLQPGKNFGLTMPSDLIWDAILGCNTICNPAEPSNAATHAENTPHKTKGQ